ncbi:MAG: hypothetical protein LCH81_21525 [Bacteroidetes bacterium]|nr:hypothetical protein [Bacteroidota bacterium]
MKHYALLFLLFVLGSSSKTAHPYYISVTEIRSDTQQQTFNVSCRMFTDDLQNALYQLYRYQADLEKTDSKHDPWLQKYIGEHLQISIGGKPVAFRFVGYEIEEEATWCYLEATSFPGEGPADIRNRLLYDFLPEQTNMIHFYRNGQRSSYKLVNPDASAKL